MCDLRDRMPDGSKLDYGRLSASEVHYGQAYGMQIKLFRHGLSLDYQVRSNDCWLLRLAVVLDQEVHE